MPRVLLLHHSADFPCVCADDSSGVQLALEHLSQLGHRNICYLAASELDSVSQQRVASYKTVIKRTKVLSGGADIKFLIDYRSMGYRKSGEITMEAWLKEGWSQLGYTAIVAHNEDTAIGAIKALANHGKHIPEDVSVIGFDGTETSELCTPPLTTIKVPLEEIGEQAVKVLLDQMENGIPSDTSKITLPVRLKSGESTAPIRVRSRSNLRK
jgi:LacI family transcriptional regulator